MKIQELLLCSTAVRCKNMEIPKEKTCLYIYNKKWKVTSLTTFTGRYYIPPITLLHIIIENMARKAFFQFL